MKIFQGVRGTQKQVPYIEVSKDTVYIRTNIERIEEDGFKGWQYDETQYTMREFHEMIANKSLLNEEYAVDIDFRLTLLEMGL